MNYEIELLAQNESELDIKINEYMEKGYKLINKEYDYETVTIRSMYNPAHTKTRISNDCWKATMEFRL